MKARLSTLESSKDLVSLENQITNINKENEKLKDICAGLEKLLKKQNKEVK